MYKIFPLFYLRRYWKQSAGRLIVWRVPGGIRM